MTHCHYFAKMLEGTGKQRLINVLPTPLQIPICSASLSEGLSTHKSIALPADTWQGLGPLSGLLF